MAIPVSQAYKNMMKGRSIINRIEMTITSGSQTYNLTDDDIVKGSLSINWRSSNNRDFSLGTCYSSSMSFSAFVAVFPELEGQYITIEATVFYRTGATEQAIPLGKFRCDSPTSFSMTTSYECYDDMLFFDRKIENRFSGTPYNVLSFICRKCGVEFGNTAQEIGAMINSSQNLVIDPDRVLTYRDALSYISMLLGGYCIINRYGKLVVRQMHQTPDMELVRHRRCTTSFGGYKTVFCGVRCRFLANQNFYPYTAIDPDEEGLILDLGDIPIVQDTDTVKNEILGHIFDQVTGYEYYPCEIDMVTDPSIEAGDMITTKDRYGYDRNAILTSVTCNWRSTSNIMSEGGNPKMQAVSTQEKRAMASQEADKKENTVVTATYVNADQITVGGSDQTDISSLRFVTNKDLTAIFGAEIPVYSSGDGYVEITYANSGIEGDIVKARVHTGYNLITLVNHIYYEANKVVLLQLKAQTEGIGSGTAPTLAIDQDTIRTYIFAQGLEVEAPWDGIISIQESIEYVDTLLSVYGITDGISIDIQVPIQSGLSAVLDEIAPSLNTYGISDIVSIELTYGDQILRMGMGHRAGMGRMFAPIVI